MKKKKRLKQRLKRELALSKKREQYHRGWVLMHPRKEEINLSITFVHGDMGQAVSSFSVIAILSAISYGEKSNRCGWWKVWPVILANRRLPFPGRGCATSTAENVFSFPFHSPPAFSHESIHQVTR